MTSFVMTVALGGAAFEESPVEELQILLAKVSHCLGEGSSGGTLRDSNGNTCGAWGLEPSLADDPDGHHEDGSPHE